MQGFYLIILGFLLTFFGCARFPETGLLNKRLSLEQASFFEGFYENSPRLYLLSKSKVESNFDYVKTHYPSVFKEVERVFPGNKLIVAYLVLDSDMDGQLDWVFDKQTSSLVAFDQDIDGDGVENYLDSGPFDSNLRFNDTNENKFPDHLESRDLELRSIQVEFMNNYKVYVINQSSEHTKRSLNAFKMVIDFGFYQHSFKGF